ncbi:hypothetical protein PROVRUST_06878 [Providencia rustigianii DSM 4541]|uniref:Uncharacterized protein n=1 Tax=Providencia rustigianii DSM 4541 TaxID=500637 RepID=D1P3K7_9GAMM|nr:hypothetical protein PROVRUST_06878 [Providencia rustigianii DSM 4541]
MENGKYPTLRLFCVQKMVRYLGEMITYIDNNQAMIPNYVERYHYGESISTAFVESTVNEVIAKRMAKKKTANAVEPRRRTLSFTNPSGRFK